MQTSIKVTLGLLAVLLLGILMVFNIQANSFAREAYCADTSLITDADVERQYSLCHGGW